VFRRAVLGIGAQLPFDEFLFFCSHMTISDSETTKADQAVTALSFIESNSSTLPGFFAGDLNAEPDSLAMRVLRGEAVHDGWQGDFFDSWIETHGSEPGYTYPSDDPEKRIDYIYVVPGSEMEVRFESCERVFDQPVGGVMASDHIGLFCRYTLLR